MQQQNQAFRKGVILTTTAPTTAGSGGGSSSSAYHGKREERWKLLQKVGEGAYSVVWCAENVSTAEKVAIKRSRVNDKTMKEQMELEVEILRLSKLQKEACGDTIVGYVSHEIMPGKDEQQVCQILLVMQFGEESVYSLMQQALEREDRYDGKSKKKGSSRGSSSGVPSSPGTFRSLFPESQILQIALDVSKALNFLHHKCSISPICHRDLKPENILVFRFSSTEVRYKLCDFSSSTRKVYQLKTPKERSIAEDDFLYNTTVSYRAPEMTDLYSGFTIDVKADIWAFGVLCYYVSFFTLPFGESVMLIQKGKYTLPETATSLYSEDLLKLIQRCLAVNPTSRPAASDIFAQVFQLLATRNALPSRYLSSERQNSIPATSSIMLQASPACEEKSLISADSSQVGFSSEEHNEEVTKSLYHTFVSTSASTSTAAVSSVNSMLPTATALSHNPPSPLPSRSPRNLSAGPTKPGFVSSTLASMLQWDGEKQLAPTPSEVTEESSEFAAPNISHPPSETNSKLCKTWDTFMKNSSSSTNLGNRCLVRDSGKGAGVLPQQSANSQGSSTNHRGSESASFNSRSGYNGVIQPRHSSHVDEVTSEVGPVNRNFFGDDSDGSSDLDNGGEVAEKAPENAIRKKNTKREAEKSDPKVTAPASLSQHLRQFIHHSRSEEGRGAGVGTGARERRGTVTDQLAPQPKAAVVVPGVRRSNSTLPPSSNSTLQLQGTAVAYASASERNLIVGNGSGGAGVAPRTASSSGRWKNMLGNLFLPKDAVLQQNVTKATKKDMDLVKPKHTNRVIHELYPSGKFDISRLRVMYECLKQRPVTTDALVCLKALLLVHKVLLDTTDEVQSQAELHLQFLHFIQRQTPIDLKIHLPHGESNSSSGGGNAKSSQAPSQRLTLSEYFSTPSAYLSPTTTTSQSQPKSMPSSLPIIQAYTAALLLKVSYVQLHLQLSLKSPHVGCGSVSVDKNITQTTTWIMMWDTLQELIPSYEAVGQVLQESLARREVESGGGGCGKEATPVTPNQRNGTSNAVEDGGSGMGRPSSGMEMGTTSPNPRGSLNSNLTAHGLPLLLSILNMVVHDLGEISKELSTHSHLIKSSTLAEVSSLSETLSKIRLQLRRTIQNLQAMSSGTASNGGDSSPSPGNSPLIQTRDFSEMGLQIPVSSDSIVIPGIGSSSNSAAAAVCERHADANPDSESQLEPQPLRLRLSGSGDLGTRRSSNVAPGSGSGPGPRPRPRALQSCAGSFSSAGGAQAQDNAKAKDKNHALSSVLSASVSVPVPVPTLGAPIPIVAAVEGPLLRKFSSEASSSSSSSSTSPLSASPPPILSTTSSTPGVVRMSSTLPQPAVSSSSHALVSTSSGSSVTSLSSLLKLPSNRICFDCGSRNPPPMWASVNLGIFICQRCAGFHRQLSTDVSRVKSVNLDHWNQREVEMMAQMGNAKRAQLRRQGQGQSQSQRPVLAESDFADVPPHDQALAFQKYLQQKYTTKPNSSAQ